MKNMVTVLPVLQNTVVQCRFCTHGFVQQLQISYRKTSYLPPVDGGVTLPEPADSGDFVFLTPSTEIHNHVVFCDHQFQSPDHVPAPGQNCFSSQSSWTLVLHMLSVFVQCCTCSGLKVQS